MTKKRDQIEPTDTNTPQKDFKKKSAKRRRQRGTGSIYKCYTNKKKTSWYYRLKLKTRDGDGNLRIRTVSLQNEDGSRCTTEQDAKKAAAEYQKILRAKSKIEITAAIAEDKQIIRRSGLKLPFVWDWFKGCPNRPDFSKKTEAKYEMFLRFFVEWIRREHPEIERVSDVSHDTAEAFMRYYWTKDEKGISAMTYNMCAQALRFIFKYLVNAEELDENPFEKIQHIPNEVVSRKEFSAEQVKMIFDGFQTGFFYETEVERIGKGRTRERMKVKQEYVPMFKDEMRVLFLLCRWTGCRGQDAALMEWKNIDLKGGEISFIPRKTARKTGGRSVILPIAPDLFKGLTDALEWREKNKAGDDYVLPKIAACYKPNDDGTPNQLSSGIQKSAMKLIRCAVGEETSEKDTGHRRKIAANVYGLHSFRHTFVSFCANAGVPLAVVAEIVGHGNPAMTNHYFHASIEAKKKAIAANVAPEDDVIDEPLSLRRKTIIEALQVADSGTIARIETILGILPQIE